MRSCRAAYIAKRLNAFSIILTEKTDAEVIFAAFTNQRPPGIAGGLIKAPERGRIRNKTSTGASECVRVATSQAKTLSLARRACKNRTALLVRTSKVGGFRN